MSRMIDAAGIQARLEVLGASLGAPEGAQVVAGNANISQQGALTTIRTGRKAIINFQQFNILKGETVQFIQPGKNARVLNRIVGGDPTTAKTPRASRAQRPLSTCWRTSVAAIPAARA